MENVKNYHPDALSDIIKYNAQCPPFSQYLFTPDAFRELKPIVWWISLPNKIHPSTLQLAKQLHGAVVSSAGLERLFSSFGYVHSKTRNRLGVAKAAKLVSTFRLLNIQTFHLHVMVSCQKHRSNITSQVQWGLLSSVICMYNVKCSP